MNKKKKIIAFIFRLPERELRVTKEELQLIKEQLKIYESAFGKLK